MSSLVTITKSCIFCIDKSKTRTRQKPDKERQLHITNICHNPCFFGIRRTTFSQLLLNKTSNLAILFVLVIGSIKVVHMVKSFQIGVLSVLLNGCHFRRNTFKCYVVVYAVLVLFLLNQKYPLVLWEYFFSAMLQLTVGQELMLNMSPFNV